jgi:hypothetical protein
MIPSIPDKRKDKKERKEERKRALNILSPLILTKTP